MHSFRKFIYCDNVFTKPVAYCWKMFVIILGSRWRVDCALQVATRRLCATLLPPHLTPTAGLPLFSLHICFFFFFLSYSYLFVSCFFINSLIWIFGLRGLFFLSSLILICLLVVSLSIHWFRYLVLTVWPLLDF